MDKVRVAIIGAGAMANAAHAPSLSSLNDVAVVGICDLIEQRAQDTAAKFGIPASFVDFHEMIEKTKPDAVWIVIWPHQLIIVVISFLESHLEN